ncbi:unnamed protein product, partial [Pylaiella littoralis]
ERRQPLAQASEMRPNLGGAVSLNDGGDIESSVGEVEEKALRENLEKSATIDGGQQQDLEQEEGGGAGGGGNGRDDEGGGNAAQEKQKVEMLSLGGRITATHRKISKLAGSRPRMVGDAIRDDMLDCINHFVCQGCMKFSSFRLVWRSRKLSLLHFGVPKMCNDLAVLQLAFSLALDLLMKEEETCRGETAGTTDPDPVHAERGGNNTDDNDDANDADNNDGGGSGGDREGGRGGAISSRSKNSSRGRGRGQGGRGGCTASGRGGGGAGGGASSTSSSSSRTSPAATAVPPPTLPAHDVGPGSLPFQIGALYTLYSLHGTQLFRSPPTPIRVSAASILALVRLRWRLQAAGPRALDALAVLARLVVGTSRCTRVGAGGGSGGVAHCGGSSCGGGCSGCSGGGGGGEKCSAGRYSGSALQAAAYAGPALLAFVESSIPATVVLTRKWQVREKEEKSREVERVMAEEAREAGARMTAAERSRATETLVAAAEEEDGDGEDGGVAGTAATTSWGPRKRTEAAAEAVSGTIRGLASTYREYAAALSDTGISSVTTIPTDDDHNSNDNIDDDNNNINNNNAVSSNREISAADRSQWFGRDLAAILDRSRQKKKKRSLPEAYGLADLARHPPPPLPLPPGAVSTANDSQAHPSAFKSSALPALPELPHESVGFMGLGTVTKRPPKVEASAGARVGTKARAKAAGGKRSGGGGSNKSATRGSVVASGVRDNIRLLQMELNAESDSSSSSSNSSSSSSSGSGSGSSGGEQKSTTTGGGGGRRRAGGDGSSGCATLTLPGGLGSTRSVTKSAPKPSSDSHRSSSSSSSSSSFPSEEEDEGTSSKTKKRSTGVEGNPRQSSSGGDSGVTTSAPSPPRDGDGRRSKKPRAGAPREETGVPQEEEDNNTASTKESRQQQQQQQQQQQHPEEEDVKRRGRGRPRKHPVVEESAGSGESSGGSKAAVTKRNRGHSGGSHPDGTGVQRGGGRGGGSSGRGKGGGRGGEVGSGRRGGAGEHAPIAAR